MFDESASQVPSILSSLREKICFVEAAGPHRPVGTLWRAGASFETASHH